MVLEKFINVVSVCCEKRCAIRMLRGPRIENLSLFCLLDTYYFCYRLNTVVVYEWLLLLVINLEFITCHG